jgi:hypothetical protein
MELAFTWLHQLCAPLLDLFESLPVPQREALRTVFGPSAGLKDENRHETLARMMEDEEYPYDWAHRKPKFSEPAIHVASSEGDRMRYLWDKDFAHTFHRRLDAYRNAVIARNSGPDESSPERCRNESPACAKAGRSVHGPRSTGTAAGRNRCGFRRALRPRR